MSNLVGYNQSILPMVTLENDFIRAKISHKGAELISFVRKDTGQEHIWQNEANIWPWHAPNLFPIIGGLINDELLAGGKTYHMSRHGFARQSEFIRLEGDEVHAVFSLPNSEHTLQVYPYRFDFQVLYTLIDNALRITYKIINHDAGVIYFSVGGHPAFRVPFQPGDQYDDYYIEFENVEALAAHVLSPEGFFTGETQPVALAGNKLYLNKGIFSNDALVFKELKSRAVTIRSDKHQLSLSVEFPHFNYLGIWSKGGGDFVCIEPWLGCADTVGRHVDISRKEAIQHLKPGHVFEEAFFISI